MQGGRKTKLGLREFVTLGQFEQNIDVKAAQAVGCCRQHLCNLGFTTVAFLLDSDIVEQSGIQNSRRACL